MQNYKQNVKVSGILHIFGSKTGQCTRVQAMQTLYCTMRSFFRFFLSFILVFGLMPASFDTLSGIKISFAEEIQISESNIDLLNNKNSSKEDSAILSDENLDSSKDNELETDTNINKSAQEVQNSAGVSSIAKTDELIDDTQSASNDVCRLRISNKTVIGKYKSIEDAILATGKSKTEDDDTEYTIEMLKDNVAVTNFRFGASEDDGIQGVRNITFTTAPELRSKIGKNATLTKPEKGTYCNNQGSPDGHYRYWINSLFYIYNATKLNFLNITLDDIYAGNRPLAPVPPEESDPAHKIEKSYVECALINLEGNGGQVNLLNGAVLQNSNCYDNAGAIWITNGTFRMFEGSAIRNCTAQNNGGAFCISSEWSSNGYSKPQALLYGGEILGCKSAKNGGAIACYGLNMPIEQDNTGVKIHDNYAGGKGGAISYCDDFSGDNAQPLEIEVGKIYNNEAEDEAGGISISSNSNKNVNIIGGEIYDNSAPKYGGISYFGTGSFNLGSTDSLNPVKITGNMATGDTDFCCGGGIFVGNDNDRINLSGSLRIIDNKQSFSSISTNEDLCSNLYLHSPSARPNVIGELASNSSIGIFSDYSDFGNWFGTVVPSGDFTSLQNINVFHNDINANLVPGLDSFNVRHIVWGSFVCRNVQTGVEYSNLIDAIQDVNTTNATTIEMIVPEYSMDSYCYFDMAEARNITITTSDDVMKVSGPCVLQKPANLNEGLFLIRAADNVDNPQVTSVTFKDITIDGQGIASISGRAPLNVNNSNGKFILDAGATIQNNYCSGNGGAAYLSNGGELIIKSGAQILNNMAGVGSKSYGGAVANVGGILTMTGGVVAGNSATGNGGAFYSANNIGFTATTSISGGVIGVSTDAQGKNVGAKNIANLKGGGVFFSSGNMEISGNPVILGNVHENDERSNLYEDTNQQINITGEITGENSTVGVYSVSFDNYSDVFAINSTGENLANASVFENDLHKNRFGLQSATQTDIIWNTPVCRNANTGEEYMSLAAAVNDAPIATRLKEDKTIIEMLVPEHIIDSSNQVKILDEQHIIITTAKDMGLKEPCILKRGADNIDLITLGVYEVYEVYESILELFDITLDGNKEEFPNNRTGHLIYSYNNINEGVVIIGNHEFSPTLKNNNALDAQGGAIALDAGSCVEIYNGDIFGNKAKNGGAIFCAFGVVDIYSGKIHDNSADCGGAVYNASNASFCMSGGEIVNNYSTYRAGGVDATAADIIFIEKDSVIYDNACKKDLKDVRSNLCTGANYIYARNITKDANIGVYSNYFLPGSKFAENASYPYEFIANANRFTNDLYPVELNEDPMLHGVDTSMEEFGSVVWNIPNFKIVDKSGGVKIFETLSEAIEAVPENTEEPVFIQALPEKYSLQKTEVIPSNKKIILTTASKDATDGFPYTGQGANDTAIITRADDFDDTMLLVNGDNCQFSIDKITIDGNMKDKPSIGSLVELTNNTAELVIFDGATLTNNYSEGDASAVYVTEGHVEMFGGNITNNKTTQSGGGIRLDGVAASLTMAGGNITGNQVIKTGTTKQSGYGGGIFVSELVEKDILIKPAINKTINIQNNFADIGGGIVFFGKETMKIGNADDKGNPIGIVRVVNNNASTKAGGIWHVKGSKITIGGDIVVTGNRQKDLETENFTVKSNYYAGQDIQLDVFSPIGSNSNINVYSESYGNEGNDFAVYKPGGKESEIESNNNADKFTNDLAPVDEDYSKGAKDPENPTKFYWSSNDIFVCKICGRYKDEDKAQPFRTLQAAIDWAKEAHEGWDIDLEPVKIEMLVAYFDNSEGESPHYLYDKQNILITTAKTNVPSWDKYPYRDKEISVKANLVDTVHNLFDLTNSSNATLSLQDVILNGMRGANPNNVAAIYMSSNNVVNLNSGAEIKDYFTSNSFDFHGSAIHMRAGELNINYGSRIFNNTLQAESAVNISDDTFQAGSAIFACGNSVINMTDGNIDNNNALYFAGTICLGHKQENERLVFNMSGGKICQNSGAFGAAIYAVDGEINIMDGSDSENNGTVPEISDNYSTGLTYPDQAAGGAIVLDGVNVNDSNSSGRLIMKGGKLQRNHTNVSFNSIDEGGAILITKDNHANHEISGGLIGGDPNSLDDVHLDGNFAVCGGGVSHSGKGTLLISGNAQIAYNHIEKENTPCFAGGGVRVVGKSRVELSGTPQIINNFAVDLIATDPNYQLFPSNLYLEKFFDSDLAEKGNYVHLLKGFEGYSSGTRIGIDSYTPSDTKGIVNAGGARFATVAEDFNESANSAANTLSEDVLKVFSNDIYNRQSAVQYTKETIKDNPDRYDTPEQGEGYVRWSGEYIPISLDKNYDDAPSPDTIYEKYGFGFYTNREYTSSEQAIVKLPDNLIPKRLGYIFKGFYETAKPDESALPVISEDGTINIQNTNYEQSSMLYAKFIPDNSNYNVEFYFQDVDDSEYTINDNLTSVMSGLTDNETNIGIDEDQDWPKDVDKNFEGFTLNRDMLKQVNITSDGKAVVNVYFDRNSYEIVLTAGDNIVSVSGENNSVKYGKDVSISAVPDLGYHFLKWVYTDGEKQGQPVEGQTFGIPEMKFTMPSHNIHYTALAEANTNTPYMYWDYNQKLDGTWSDIPSNFRGETGTTGEKIRMVNGIWAEPLADSNNWNFTIDKTHDDYPDSQDKAVTITGDGKAVQKLYYTRNKQTISLNKSFNNSKGIKHVYALSSNSMIDTVDPVQPIGSGDNIVIPDAQYKAFFGSSVTVVAEVEPGYEFDKWVYTLDNDNVRSSSVNYGFITGEVDINLLALAKPKNDTKFSVNFFQQLTNGSTNPDDYEFISSIEKKGTTDTDTGLDFFSEEFTNRYAGFHVSSVNIPKNVNIMGNGMTVVEVYYDRNIHSLTLKADSHSQVSIDSSIPSSSSISKSGILYGSDVVISAIINTGYIFDSWTYNNPEGNLLSGAAVYVLQMKDEDLVLQANTAPSQFTSYTVEHQLEQLDDTYKTVAYEYGVGITGELTSAQVNTYSGFTAVTPVEQRIIAADGSTVVVVKYKRDTFNLTLTAGEYIDHVYPVPQAGQISIPVKYQDTVKIYAVAQQGYKFNEWSWTDSSGSHTSSSIGYNFTMPAEDMSFTASGQPSEATYKVLHYKQKAVPEEGEDDFELADTVSMFGLSGEQTQAVAKEYFGFTSGQVPIETINGDGSTEVKIYYERNIHTIVVHKNDNIDSTSPEADIVVEYRYDAPVTLSATAVSDYKFDYWSEDAAGERPIIDACSWNFSMPNDDLEYWANASQITDTLYYVNHYVENEDGEWVLTDVQNLYGPIGSMTEATPIDYGNGYTLYAPIKQEIITADPISEVDIKYSRNTYNLILNANSNIDKLYINDVQVDPGDKLQVKYGQNVKITAVPSHGFKFKDWTYDSDGLQQESDAVCHILNVDGDITLWANAQHRPDGYLPYLVYHYKQNVDGSWMPDDLPTEVEECYGVIGELTEAVSKDFGSGFTLQAFDQVTITDDPIAIVKIRYVRNKYNLDLYGDEGIEQTSGDWYQANYESSVQINATLKDGFKFKEWQDITDPANPKFVTNSRSFMVTIYNHMKYKAISEPIANTPYKVEYYFQNITDDHFPDTPSEVYQKFGVKGERVTETPFIYQGFKLARPSESTEILAEDGSTVFRFYYERETYNVTLHANEYVTSVSIGEMKDPAKIVLPIKYGASAVISAMTAPGYSFDCWSIDKDAFEPIDDAVIWTISDVNSDIEFWANAKADYAKYYVQHYQQNAVNDDYSLFETEEFYALTGDDAVASEKNYYGFHVVGSVPSEVKTVSGDQDNPTIVCVYYDRNIYTLYVNKDELTASVDGAGKYKYGAPVTVAAVSYLPGYHFSKWTETDASGSIVSVMPNYSFLNGMPLGDYTIYANSVANPNADYKVRHYLQNPDGSYPSEPEKIDYLSGIIDTQTNAKISSFAGFTSPSSVDQKIILRDGSTVIDLYYTRNGGISDASVDTGDSYVNIKFGIVLLSILSFCCVALYSCIRRKNYIK